jgi:hypothetical protein
MDFWIYEGGSPVNENLEELLEFDLILPDY